MSYWEATTIRKGWEEFLLAAMQRFDPELQEDYVGRLATLRQTSSVEAYQASFEALLPKASQVGDSMLSSLFTAGLKEPLRQGVLMRQPSTLQNTFAIAQRLQAWHVKTASPGLFTRTEGTSHEQRPPNCTTVNREPGQPPCRNKDVTEVIVDNQSDALTLNIESVNNFADGSMKMTMASINNSVSTEFDSHTMDAIQDVAPHWIGGDDKLWVETRHIRGVSCESMGDPAVSAEHQTVTICNAQAVAMDSSAPDATAHSSLVAATQFECDDGDGDAHKLRVRCISRSDIVIVREGPISVDVFNGQTIHIHKRRPNAETPWRISDIDVEGAAADCRNGGNFSIQDVKFSNVEILGIEKGIEVNLDLTCLVCDEGYLKGSIGIQENESFWKLMEIARNNFEKVWTNVPYVVPLDPHSFVDRLNCHLSPQTRLFGCKRATPSFNAKKFCDWWRYLYLVPVCALDRESVMASMGMGKELVTCIECSARGRKVFCVMGKHTFDPGISLNNGSVLVETESVTNDSELKSSIENGNGEDQKMEELDQVNQVSVDEISEKGNGTGSNGAGDVGATEEAADFKMKYIYSHSCEAYIFGKSYCYSYFAFHLEGKVVFNGGGVDRDLDFATTLPDTSAARPQVQPVQRKEPSGSSPKEAYPLHLENEDRKPP